MQRYENRIATIGKEDSCNFRRSGVSLVLDGERYPLGELAPVGMIGFDFGIGLAAQRKRLDLRQCLDRACIRAVWSWPDRCVRTGQPDTRLKSGERLAHTESLDQRWRDMRSVVRQGTKGCLCPHYDRTIRRSRNSTKHAIATTGVCCRG